MKTVGSGSPRSKLEPAQDIGEGGGRLPGKVTQVVAMYGTARKLPHNGDAARGHGFPQINSVKLGHSLG